MDAIIKARLLELEKRNGVKILYACETGSRAWGFPSPDSDYDVRMIYKHDLDWYLSLSDQKDTIEFMSDDNELDVTGWDIKKCLKLMWKSNGALLERVQSPIVYINEQSTASLLKEYAFLCYSPIATMNHYLGMAKKCFSEIDGKEEVKLKKLFYALRASLASKWILTEDTPPPIVFNEMVKHLKFDEKLKVRIAELIALKLGKSESYMHPAENDLNTLIRNEIANAEASFNSLKGRKAKNVQLDVLFRQMVKNN